MVSVKKKDGTTRPCLDYWRLNKVTLQEMMARMEEVFNHLGQAALKLRENTGYPQDKGQRHLGY